MTSWRSWRALALVLVAGAAFSAAACANILGFEDLTSSGAGDGGSSDGASGGSDGSSGDGSANGIEPPTDLSATAVACTVGTLVTGSCDGGSFCHPRSVAVDDANQLYMIDQTNVIHQVSPTGAVTPLTTNLVDGGPAAFNQPSAITFSHDDGALYAADKYSVQHIALPSGATTEVAGSATFGHADDAGAKATFAGITALSIQPGASDVWVADHNDVRFIALPGDVVGTVTNGDRGLPQGIVAHGGNVYFATTTGMSIPAGVYMFAAGTTSIAAFSNVLSTPEALAVGGDILYIVNGNSAAIFRADLTKPPAPSLLAGGGTGGVAVDGPCTGTGAAQFAQPEGIAVDAQRTIYVADETANSIRTIHQGFGEISVSWTASTPPSGRTIDGYEARAKLAGTTAGTCATTGATTCTITGLTSGTAYDVTVVTKSGTDTSAEAASVKATPN